MTEPTRTIKIYEKTHPALRLLAAITGETMMELIDRLVTEEMAKTKSTRKPTMHTRSKTYHFQSSDYPLHPATLRMDRGDSETVHHLTDASYNRFRALANSGQCSVEILDADHGVAWQLRRK